MLLDSITSLVNKVLKETKRLINFVVHKVVWNKFIFKLEVFFKFEYNFLKKRIYVIEKPNANKPINPITILIYFNV